MWFCAGETSRALALSLAFAAENIKNLPLALRALKKNWARLESPSLPISRSGSWPQREGLLSPAARQIYRRKFPPVGFIRSLFNHEWFYWCAVNETRSRHMKRDLNCFDPNSIELCIFCRLYFDFFLSPVFKYKALVGDLSSFIRALYQGRIFLTATEQKRYRLVLLWAHALQSFYFFMFCFMAYANLATILTYLNSTYEGLGPKHLETELTNITSPDGTFVHYQFFVLNISLFTLLTFSHRNFFFRYLFVLIYFDGSRRYTHSTTHSTGTQIVRAKMTSLDGFFAGKQVELTFVAENIKNLPLALSHARERIWGRLVGKSRAQLAGKSTLTWFYAFVLSAPQWWRV